uniref:G-protein coupled receptors family 1 profile domain-containing protein n=1 Tax=Cyprinus carpio TaxID=7962 RepID=A0A8C1W3N9_CYPCA
MQHLLTLYAFISFRKMILASTMDLNTSVNCTIWPHENAVEQYMYPEAYSMFFIIGFPANCLSLYVAWVLMKKGNNLAVYLINLSVGDLLYILTLPIWIMMALGYEVNDSLCSIIAVVMFNSFYVGSGFLCCISMDRYLAIVFPLYFARVREVRTAVLVSSIVWLVEIVLHLGLLIYRQDIWNFSASRMCEEPMMMSSAAANVAITLGFLIPALVVGFCYWRIYSAVKKNQKLESMERRHVFRLLGSILLTLYLCFGPVHIMMVLRIFLEDCPYPNWLFIGYKVCVLLAMLNCLADPLLYCFMSRMGQASASNVLLILRRRGKKDSPLRTELSTERL